MYANQVLIPTDFLYPVANSTPPPPPHIILISEINHNIISDTIIQIPTTSLLSL